MGEIDLMPFFFGLTCVLHFFFAMGVFSATRGLRRTTRSNGAGF